MNLNNNLVESGVSFGVCCFTLCYCLVRLALDSALEGYLCSLHSDKVVYLLPQIVDSSQTHLILRVAAIFICNFMATTSKPLSFENLHPK